MAAIRPVSIVGYTALMAIFAGACIVSANGGPLAAPMVLATVMPLTAIPAMRGHSRISLLMTASAPLWVAATAALLERVGIDSLILEEAPAVTMLWFGLTAGAGYVLGRAANRGMPFSVTLVAVVALTFGASALFMASAWDVWARAAQQAYDVFDANQVRSAQSMDVPAEIREARRALLKFMLVDHWLDFSIGAQFMVTICTCAPIAAAIGLLVRLRGQATGFRVGWMETRTPDWLAWIAIAVGAMWLLNDQVQQHAWLQAISWNGALALFGVYWVNGTGLTFYMLRSMGIHWSIWLVAALVMVMFPHANLTLAIVGLFDTWANFRVRADRALELAQERKDNDDDRPA